jgi:glutamine synthetase
MAASQMAIIQQISEHIEIIKEKTDAMTDARRGANKLKDSHKKATSYCESVKSYFDEIRYNCDKLEQVVDDQDWPLTKYRELLFIK